MNLDRMNMPPTGSVPKPTSSIMPIMASGSGHQIMQQPSQVPAMMMPINPQQWSQQQHQPPQSYQPPQAYHPSPSPSPSPPPREQKSTKSTRSRDKNVWMAHFVLAANRCLFVIRHTGDGKRSGLREDRFWEWYLAGIEVWLSERTDIREKSFETAVTNAVRDHLVDLLDQRVMVWNEDRKSFRDDQAKQRADDEKRKREEEKKKKKKGDRDDNDDADNDDEDASMPPVYTFEPIYVDTDPDIKTAVNWVRERIDTFLAKNEYNYSFHSLKFVDTYQRGGHLVRVASSSSS